MAPPVPTPQETGLCLRIRYFRPVAKKQAAATIPKRSGANRGKYVMGKIVRNTAAA
jgi:hypothetical protein